MDKSFVTLEQNICQVCGTKFDTGALLLDRRMRDTFDKYTVTDYGLCPECQKLNNDGYIALVVADPAKSKTEPNGNLKIENAYRTGEIIHLRYTAFERIFNMPHNNLPMGFIDQETAKKLKELPKNDN